MSLIGEHPKGEGDTALEAEAQLYSDNSIDLKIMQVKE